MNRARSIWVVTCFVALAFVWPAWAGRPEPNPAEDAEREVLIDKLARGVEVEASVRRFKELVQKRDQRVATSKAAQDKERADRDARRAWLEEFRKSADYEVSTRCTLSADPANPVPSKEGRYTGDWGKVVRKESLRMAPKNELDEGEPVTIYEVAGQKQHYFVRGERAGMKREPFVAEKGDLVAICHDGETVERKLPPPWDKEKIVQHGFAVKVASPPLIAKKMKWNPIHITATRFYWAIRDVKWSYPDDAFVLSNIEIAEDLGGGRYRIDADNSHNMDWILEVPPHLLHKDILQPGHYVWVIMGNHRFDKALKKLVLVAADLEARYVIEAR